MQTELLYQQTQRLRIRKYRQEDLQALYTILSDPEVVKFEPYKPMSLEQTQEELAWRLSADCMLAVESKADGVLVGNIYAHETEFQTLELGYVFGRSYWHMGYASESCAAVICHAFEAGIHRIVAECDPQNPASWKLLERLGFEKEGHLHENVYFWTDENQKPIWKDTFLYAKRNR